MGETAAAFGLLGILISLIPLIFFVVFMFVVMYGLGKTIRQLEYLNRQVKAFGEKLTTDE